MQVLLLNPEQAPTSTQGPHGHSCYGHRGRLLKAKEPVPDFLQGKSGASVPWFIVILGLEFNLAVTFPVCYKGLLAVFCSLCLIASLLGTFYKNNMVLERPVSRVGIKKHHNHRT